MRSTTSRFSLVLAGAVLFTTIVALAGSRLEYCGPIEISQPHHETRNSVSTSTPTLAPRQNLVVVQVESDRPDIQVGWAD
jgi:hypothetical protein